MKKYIVEVIETVRRDFEVSAENKEQAEENYADGNEIGWSQIESNITNMEEIMTSKVLKETFSDEQTTVSEVDADELHKHISKNDSHTISDIVFDALIDMGIDQDGFAWDINVTVEQNNNPIAKIGAVNENDALDMTIRIMDKLSEMKILNKKQSRDEDFAIQDAIIKEIEIVFNRMSLKDQIDNNSISIGEFHNEQN